MFVVIDIVQHPSYSRFEHSERQTKHNIASEPLDLIVLLICEDEALGMDLWSLCGIKKKEFSETA